ncbi:MAG: hypothetical protein HYX27_21425 [Acidobacteria bacterium]|nr:hypothetical protein [Acidobacteriota bacterium]
MLRIWASFLLWPLCAGAQPLAPEVLLLSRIKRHMEQVLGRQPNYTCQETIERSRRTAKAKRFQLVDALHLEVAVVEGKELFSWPGEREFKDRDLRELAPSGMIGNGSFALHARAVFLSNTPMIAYNGEEALNGRAAARYDFSVPQYRSGYQIKIGDAKGITGYKGSFWSDLETLDLLQLHIEAIEIPPHLPLRGTTDTMRYERVPIGESTFLLPQSSEMVIDEFDGAQSRNSIRFSRCRQYSGESTLSFAEVPEGETSPVPLPEAINLPAGLLIEIALGTRVKFPGSAIGDEIEASVVRNVKRKGIVNVPKGAVLKGNIALLERRKDTRGQERVLVAIQWREISFDGKSGPFEGQLENGGAIPVNEFSSRGVYQRPTQAELNMLPHRDVFYVRKDTLDLPRGLPLILRTLSAESSGAKKP